MEKFINGEPWPIIYRRFNEEQNVGVTWETPAILMVANQEKMD